MRDLYRGDLSRAYMAYGTPKQVRHDLMDMPYPNFLLSEVSRLRTLMPVVSDYMKRLEVLQFPRSKYFRLSGVNTPKPPKTQLQPPNMLSPKKLTIVAAILLFGCKYNNLSKNKEDYQLIKGPERCFKAVCQKDSAFLKLKTTPDGKVCGKLTIKYG